MTPALLLAAGLICAPPADGPESRAVPPTPDLAAYQQARDRAGRDADAQVRLALWCEAHGLPAERLKHLALAALRDPKNAAARGLMGMVRFQGRWSRPEAVARKVESDADYAARLAEYHQRREKAGPTADAQARLAQWCEEAGLEDEARAHHAAVLRVEPNRELSRKKLGYKKDGRRWVTDEQLAAEKEDARLQKEADRKWRASLTAWRGWLGDDGPRREQAARELSNVTDPRAVPSVLAVFGRGKPVDRDRAVRLLGQIDAAGSSRALAGFAVFDESAEVRRGATETLRRRDPREFAGLLVALLRDPIKYEVRPVGGPGSPGALFVNGERFNVRRVYAPPAVPAVAFDSSSRFRLDADGLPLLERTLGWYGGDRYAARVGEEQALAIVQAEVGGPKLPDSLVRSNPVLAEMERRNVAGASNEISAFNSKIRDEVRHSPDGKVNVHRDTIAEVRQEIPIGRMILEARQAAVLAEQQLENDVSTLEAWNRQAREGNDRVVGVLNAVAGKDLSVDSSAWKTWWVDQLGFRSGPAQQTASVPTVVENVPLGYLPQTTPWVASTIVVDRLTDFRWFSCFGAGTAVLTLDGSRPIETLRVGDRVLTQSVADGSLGYHPITAVHHNPPSPTFLVRVAGDTIVSSPFHRFWAAGRGWVMARDLEGGEVLRLLEGTRAVDSVEAGPVQPVFNLDVSGDHDFFAGKAAALVHDNSLPDARLVPFDAAPGLAAVAATRGK